MLIEYNSFLKGIKCLNIKNPGATLRFSKSNRLDRLNLFYFLFFCFYFRLTIVLIEFSNIYFIDASISKKSLKK